MSELYQYIGSLNSKPKRLNEVDSERLSLCRNKLANLWKLEDLFEVFASSLFEIEIALLRQALKYQITGKSQTNDVVRNSSELNAKFSSLLFCGRAYEEQAKKIIDHSFPDVSDDFCGLFSEAYDNSFEYRLIYALRNCLAHGSTAIIVNTFSSRREEGESDAISRLRLKVSPRVKINDLLKLGKLKGGVKPTLKEMLGSFSQIDLALYWRVYCSTISKAHLLLRQRTETELEQLLKCVEDSQNLIDEDKHFGSGVYLIPTIETDFSEWLPFSRGHFENIQNFRQNYVNLGNFARCYVTNEINSGNDLNTGKNSSLFIPD